MSDFQVTLPKLGESILSATVVQWFKKEGEPIKKDEPLLEVATDKVNSEIPSPVSGVVKTINAKPDEELNVGELLAVIAQEGEGAVETSEEKTVERAAETESSEMQDYYSPALLRIARENGISLQDLEKIRGTGSGGRITKKDLEDHIESGSKPCPLALPTGDGIEHVKMKGLRKAIAENTVKSFYEAPHASLITEIDVTALMEKIKNEKAAFLEKHGVKLTITSFVAQAIAKALKEYPWLNSSLIGDTIVVKHFINVGIAVSVDQGIMVPVIRNCEKLDLPQIASAVADFAAKARTSSLEPDDVKEGTITVTNFGITGIQTGIPIIRHPEVAIIGLGGITKKVGVLDDDTFAVRKVMNVTLTIDHRVIDGMYGCGFLGVLKKELELDA